MRRWIKYCIPSFLCLFFFRRTNKKSTSIKIQQKKTAAPPTFSKKELIPFFFFTEQLGSRSHNYHQKQVVPLTATQIIIIIIIIGRSVQKSSPHRYIQYLPNPLQWFVNHSQNHFRLVSGAKLQQCDNDPGQHRDSHPRRWGLLCNQQSGEYAAEATFRCA